ncbi:hypothetical protein BU17DRAFT_84632 [Hysterangium stoloniferum]|nr:hypothetical protein BU17DRAFT_84632 [Hysterangium stoloniferum]
MFWRNVVSVSLFTSNESDPKRYYSEVVTTRRIGPKHHNKDGVVVTTADVAGGHGRRRDRRRYYSRSYENKPSILHGYWNKFIGALTGNRRRRRHGDREIHRARNIRRAIRTAQRVRNGRSYGDMNKLHKHRHRRPHQDGHGGGVNVLVANLSGHHGRTPWFHDPHRTAHPHSGLQHIILGYLTGNRKRRDKGRAIMAAVAEERRRQRQLRRDDMSAIGRQHRTRVGRWV